MYNIVTFQNCSPEIKEVLLLKYLNVCLSSHNICLRQITKPLRTDKSPIAFRRDSLRHRRHDGAARPALLLPVRLRRHRGHLLVPVHLLRGLDGVGPAAHRGQAGRLLSLLEARRPVEAKQPKSEDHSAVRV